MTKIEGFVQHVKHTSTAAICCLFKETNIKRMVDILAKVGEDKNCCHYFIFVIKK